MWRPSSIEKIVLLPHKSQENCRELVHEGSWKETTLTKIWVVPIFVGLHSISIGFADYGEISLSYQFGFSVPLSIYNFSFDLNFGLFATQMGYSASQGKVQKLSTHIVEQL